MRALRALYFIRLLLNRKRYADRVAAATIDTCAAPSEGIMHSMRNYLALSTLLAIFAVLSADAQAPAARPNFSGVWIMDTAKSPGPMIPQAMTYAIEQRGDTIRIRRDTKSMRGEFSASLIYGADGKPWKNSINEGGIPRDVSSVLTWEGSTLVITSTINASGQIINQVEKWTLDATGQTITADRTAEAMGQQFATKMVFNKRP